MHHMIILGYLVVSTIFTLCVLGYCSHNNGDTCNGEAACCTDAHTIARCSFPAYDSIGHWEVDQCGGLINVCLDDGSPVGADCD